MECTLNLPQVQHLQRFAGQYCCLQGLYHLLNLQRGSLYCNIMDGRGRWELCNLYQSNAYIFNKTQTETSIPKLNKNDVITLDIQDNLNSSVSRVINEMNELRQTLHQTLSNDY